MEQIGLNQAQGVQSFQGKKLREDVGVTQPEYTPKKDGDKKLAGALAGLAAIGLGGVLVAVDLHKGKGSKLRKIFTKGTKEVAETVGKKTRKALTPAAADSEIAKKIRALSPNEAGEKYSKIQKSLGGTVENLKKLLGDKKAVNNNIEMLNEEISKKSALVKGATGDAAVIHSNALAKLNEDLAKEQAKLSNIDKQIAKAQKSKENLAQLLTDFKEYGSGIKIQSEEDKLRKKMQKHGATPEKIEEAIAQWKKASEKAAA